MARPSKTDQERGYLSAFWKEIRMMEADFGGIVTISANPSPRPGIFIFRLGFTPIYGELNNPLGTQAYSTEFPNGAAQTLAGALWAAAMKLTGQVSEEYWARRGGPGKNA